MNHVGHVVLERDAAGVVLDTPHRYTPYGVLLGDDVTPQEAPRFGGTLRDPVSGLDDFHTRHFASDYGRFLSSDGAHDGSNYYTYANNDPLKYIDPDGQQAVSASAKVGNVGILGVRNNAVRNLVVGHPFVVTAHPVTVVSCVPAAQEEMYQTPQELRCLAASDLRIGMVFATTTVQLLLLVAPESFAGSAITSHGSLANGAFAMTAVTGTRTKIVLPNNSVRFAENDTLAPTAPVAEPVPA